MRSRCAPPAPTRPRWRAPAGWLRRAQNADGGWGIQPLAPSESDSTGAALQGLVAAGERRPRDGARRLVAAQGPAPGRRLRARRQRRRQLAVDRLGHPGPRGDRGRLGRGRRRALSYLSHRRAADGHYRYSASSDQTPIWVTAQALLAVERQPFPLPAVARAARASDADAGGSTATGGRGRSGAGQRFEHRFERDAELGLERGRRSPGGAARRRRSRARRGDTPSTSADPGRSARRRPRPPAPGATAAAGSPDQPAGADDTAAPVSVSDAAGDGGGDSTTPTCWSAWARWRCWSRAPTPGTGAAPRAERGPPR